jgi:prepilin-type N-terminal cleavage/methylation domain-containing protein
MHLNHPDVPSRRRAFTLIELLTVIAIIGILAALLFPAISSVITKAHKAAVKNQLSQWTVAAQAFKSDYSFYPQLDGAYGSSNGSANVVNPAKFAIALTGTQLDGTVLPSAASPTDLVGNTKRRLYYSIGNSELLLTDGVATGLKDAFDNTEFAYLYDSNGDGFVRNDDKVYNGAAQAAPTITAATNSKFTPDATNDVNLVKGIRAGVLFYSPGPGNSDGSAIDSTNVIFSWK